MAYIKVGPWVNGAAPALSAANLDQIETQYSEAVTDIGTHAALTTGTHGAGASTIATTANIITHSGLTTGVHGVGGGTVAKVADIVATKLDDFTTPDDNIDLNSTTTEHGLLKKLDNVATHYMNGQGNWATPPSTTLTVAETQVFAGNSPIAWTDLDLSGVIGANPAIVWLKVYSGAGGANISWAGFRINGDAEPTATATTYGSNIIHCGVVDFIYVVVPTDANGIIEWITNLAKAITVDVVGYIK